MDLLPNSAPLARKLRNTLIQYHSVGDGEWRMAKKTVSGLCGFVRAGSLREAAGHLWKELITLCDTGVKHLVNSCGAFVGKAL